MRWMIALVMVVVLAGCVVAPRKAAYLQVGLTGDQVYSRCGYALHRRQWSDGSAVWCYGDGTTVVFRRGRVVSWSW